MTYKKVSDAELTAHIWDNVRLTTRYEFVADNNDPINFATANEFSVAMIVVAGQTMIVANCYGGGKPFCFSAVTKDSNAKDRFVEEFCSYLHDAGKYYWLNPASFEARRSHRTQPLEIGLREFATILLENSDTPKRICFDKPDKDTRDIYADEQFTFVFTDVAETMVGICNSDSRSKQFCGDVSDDSCISSFVSEFVKYLKSCGFSKNVRVLFGDY